MKKVTSVFWISLAISAIFVLWGAFAPTHLGEVSSDIQGFLTSKFGWFYLLSVTVFLVFSIYLIFSPYGKIRLGKPDDRPEYNKVTWFAMLFSAGMGIGLVFWGSAEPLAHFATPPQAEPESVEAARDALRYSFFHWGFHTWAIYTVIALGIAYFKFRRGAPGVISATFKPILGDRVYGPIGKTIDVIAVFATIFGVATSLGLGASQIGGGLAFITDIENNISTQFVIIAIVTVLFMISAWTGLSKGIKYLSNTNIVLALGLILLTIILGPSVFIMDIFSSTLGSYFQNLPIQSFQMAPLTSDYNEWIQGWTVFYWAWFIAWSPFVGTFIARVSKGRTIREFVTGVLLVPSLFSMFWFAVFGGSSLKQELDGVNTGLTDLATESALFGTFESFPFGIVLTIIAIVLISTFFITSADSATFVLGMQTTNGSLNPPNVVKLSWGVIQAATAGVLLYSGGLGALQTASIVSAFPFTIILLMMVWSLSVALKEDHQKMQYQQESKESYQQSS
ncbi:glycine/betaine ABC transporter permease [Pontibacillus halophilus JSM 076056 = DSM 19796]|uniref:Glycine/betaine ABC transporter permease n=1 Tax=Pontibacillus halophilus JSM 076056 = DSM 19796 TaxID=1385510 RepID=A0A0A5GPZ8_9BACI|nr:BCCT family transporter [Pontibacillus halophilus]KGX94014.1 glycine/betaine ABC transporter permease [Pontibacillus halophilus JSM 076056 = DSM 19796]